MITNVDRGGLRGLSGERHFWDNHLCLPQLQFLKLEHLGNPAQNVLSLRRHDLRAQRELLSSVLYTGDLQVAAKFADKNQNPNGSQNNAITRIKICEWRNLPGKISEGNEKGNLCSSHGALASQTWNKSYLMLYLYLFSLLLFEAVVQNWFRLTSRHTLLLSCISGNSKVWSEYFRPDRDSNPASQEWESECSVTDACISAVIFWNNLAN